MNIVKNILGVIGGLVVAGILIAFVAFDLGGIISKAKKLDPNAIGSYMEMADVVLETGDAGLAMTKLVKVEEGVEIDDIRDTLKSVAADNNMLTVGDTIMFRNGQKDFAGNDTRHVEIFSFCNKQIARSFIDYSKAFGAFMPCRVILIQDTDGSLWLATMKLDLMIAGGHPLSPEMLKMAKHVAKTMYEMVDKAAAGEF